MSILKKLHEKYTICTSCINAVYTCFVFKMYRQNCNKNIVCTNSELNWSSKDGRQRRLVAVAPAAVAVAHASLVRGGKFRQERHHSVLEPPVCGVAFQHATHHPGLGAEIV